MALSKMLIVDWVKQSAETWGDQTFRTRDLIDTINTHLGDGSKAGASFISATLIKAAPYELAEYATQGDPVQGAGYNANKTIRPWLWHSRQSGRVATEKPASMLERMAGQIDRIEALLLKGR